MSKRILLSISGLLLLILATSFTIETSIDGKLTHRSTKQPAQNVPVLLKLGTTIERTTYTDKNGRYHLEFNMGTTQDFKLYCVQGKDTLLLPKRPPYSETMQLNYFIP